MKNGSIFIENISLNGIKIKLDGTFFAKVTIPLYEIGILDPNKVIIEETDSMEYLIKIFADSSSTKTKASIFDLEIYNENGIRIIHITSQQMNN
ncbi:hypothetical protein [Falsibacillus albus]|uniref:Uncharacterized protein n=1 Tax=Falsibacillus albus TaxID=2478915 RepID=A0A3L7JZT6_9BACI|nr:hypothetical protein [Falsibacillus albus]RLQ96303.1 hypothetical protein D9X91_08445 [Falsibacillus albus]